MPTVASFIPFDAMTDAEQVEHLVVAHNFDADYWAPDPQADFSTLTRRQRAENWHDDEHTEAYDGLGGGRIKHVHDKKPRGDD